MTDNLTAHWRAEYDNKYLGAWDLWSAAKQQYLEVTATICNVSLDPVTRQGGQTERCWLLHLTGRKGNIETPMVVSKTSGATLQRMYGPQPRGWVGKQIVLYVKRDKRVRQGTGDVLTIRDTSRTNDLKNELASRRERAIADDDMSEPVERQPGED